MDVRLIFAGKDSGNACKLVNGILEKLFSYFQAPFCFLGTAAKGRESVVNFAGSRVLGGCQGGGGGGVPRR